MMGEEEKERQREEDLKKRIAEEAVAAALFARQDSNKSSHSFVESKNKVKVGVIQNMLVDLKTLSHEKVLSYEDAFASIE